MGGAMKRLVLCWTFFALYWSSAYAEVGKSIQITSLPLAPEKVAINMVVCAQRQQADAFYQSAKQMGGVVALASYGPLFQEGDCAVLDVLVPYQYYWSCKFTEEPCDILKVTTADGRKAFAAYQP